MTFLPFDALETKPIDVTKITAKRLRETHRHRTTELLLPSLILRIEPSFDPPLTALTEGCVLPNRR